MYLFAALLACTDPVTSDPEPTPDTDTDTEVDTGQPPALENRLANPGFELGESWWRSAPIVSHAWAATGDGVHDSTETFTAREGAHAQKLWGAYTGDVPNDSEHGLTLVDLTPGDTHTVSLWGLTHPDDALSGGTSAVVFLRFLDADGATIAEEVSAAFDEDTEPGTWLERSVSATVPEGTASGALGVRFSLAAWEATGSVYLDEVSWTSTGTGTVAGERLLVWSDEFGGTEIDDSKWTHEILAPYTYNAEMQGYTDSPSNSRVDDGKLVITARSEASGITSARLITSGKADWQYGRFEGMLWVPDGVGTWPALWMLPTDWSYGGWPDSGEIDIMEHVGCDNDTVHGTVHTGAYNHLLGTQRGGSIGVEATGGYHLYAVEWTADEMVFSVDNTAYFRFENDGAGDPSTWPFDQPFHFVANLAFGGSWGGYCGVDTGALPQEYRIDWVRVYQ